MSEDFGTFPTGAHAPTVEPLDVEASDFLAEAALAADELGLPTDIVALSEVFAERRAQWYDMAERPDPNDLVAAAGGRVGELLAATLDVDWALHTDENGLDLALVVPGERLTPREDLFVFPLDAVASLWSPDARGTLAQYHDGVVATVREHSR